MNNSDFKYWAFISYSHADEEWAKWLHKSIETYRVPRKIVGRETAQGQISRRLFPVFRDREELPGASDLGGKLQDALTKSRSLIVICSPKSAVSKWVNEEVKTYKSFGHAGRVFCLITDGEPNARAGQWAARMFSAGSSVSGNARRPGHHRTGRTDRGRRASRQRWKNKCAAEAALRRDGRRLRRTAPARTSTPASAANAFCGSRCRGAVFDGRRLRRRG